MRVDIEFFFILTLVDPYAGQHTFDLDPNPDPDPEGVLGSADYTRPSNIFYVKNENFSRVLNFFYIIQHLTSC